MLPIADASARAHGRSAGSGSQLFADGKFNQARDAFASAVRSDPKNPVLRVGLLRTYLRLDDWQNCVSEGQKAIVALPSNADAHGLLSMALMRGGRPRQAESEANKALALDAKSYYGLVARGRVLTFNEQKGEAREVLTRAFNLHPEWPDAPFYLLRVLEEKTSDEEEQKIYKAYAKTHPKGHPHDRTMDSLSRALDTYNPNNSREAGEADKTPGDKKPDGDKKAEGDKKPGKKKEAMTFEAIGAINEQKLKDADEGKIKPITITIPFERYKADNQTVLIPLSINGVTMRLLFDTGAGHSISVAGDAAERLNLPAIYKTYARGVSGKEEVRVSRAKEMKIGPQMFKNIPVDTTANAISPAFDGLIGGAVFEEYAVTIDYENNNLVLTRGKTAAAPAPEEGNHITTVPFHDFGGYIIVPLKLEDRSEAEWGLLDTGAQGMGVLSYITASQLAKKQHSDAQAKVHIDRRLGVGTSSTGFDAILFEFAIDLGLVYNAGTPYFMEMTPIYGASMIDSEVNRSFDFHLSAIVGISYLAEAKRITFDYPHHLLTMESGPKTAQP